jgi:hypothetical protein
LTAAVPIEPGRIRPWLALALSCIVHLWLVWAWRHAGSPPIPARSPITAQLSLQLRLIPWSIPVALLAHGAPAASRLQAATPRRRDQIVFLPVPLQSEPPAAITVADPSLIPPEPRHRGDLAASALAGVGKIDHDLRQAAPPRPGLLQTPANTPATRLGQGIAAAYIPTSTTMEELTTANGQKYTKVTGPFGTYCVWGRDPRPSATSFTVFDTPMRTTNCPK